MSILSRIFYSVVGVGLLAAGTSFANSLEEELATLLIDHPQIKAGKKTVESSRQEISKSWAGYLPKVSSTSNMGPEYIDSPGERARQQDNKVWGRTKVVAGMPVTQNLFNGYNTASMVKSATAGRSPFPDRDHCGPIPLSAWRRQSRRCPKAPTGSPAWPGFPPSRVDHRPASTVPPGADRTKGSTTLPFLRTVMWMCGNSVRPDKPTSPRR